MAAGLPNTWQGASLRPLGRGGYQSTLLHSAVSGDRRSIGRANEVVEDVLNDPSLFQVAFRGMLSDDPVLRMRCADVLEKVTAQRPEYLWPHKQELIEQVAPIDQQEVRWHAAQMIARLEWHVEERAAIVDILLGYLNDESKIVRTSAMQALADLAEEHQNLRAPLTDLLQQPVETGSPAMKSRGRKLLARLGREA